MSDRAGAAAGRGFLGIAALTVLAALVVPWPGPGTGSGETRHVRIEAGDFTFSPGIVDVEQGDRVTIELVSTDVAHGLHLDGYDLRLEADPGRRGTLTFVADRRGVFRFRCSTTCGPLHPFMIGKLRVGSSGLFWRGVGVAVVVALLGLAAVRR